ncbi:MAG TPA: CstA-like transporter-associated (seleno)protein [Gemmatimonadales bacterium]|nr:CstA-like transporter-associated (seleno)protein [Gemmatimonadales bacterium]
MQFRDGGRGTGDGATPLPTRIARVVRRIIGAPDYGAYLEHCRLAGHPPHLDERAYLSEFFASKGRGVRCC